MNNFLFDLDLNNNKEILDDLEIESNINESREEEEQII